MFSAIRFVYERLATGRAVRFLLWGV